MFPRPTGCFAVVRHSAIDSAMTLKHHSYLALSAWLLCLLMVSPMMLWHLPGGECCAEHDPAEVSFEVEFSEVTLCEANSLQRQVQRELCRPAVTHPDSKNQRSDSRASQNLRESAGKVSLQGRGRLLRC